MIVNAGIERVVASEVYPDSNYADLFSEAGIEFSIQKVPTLTISQKK
jgi:deoxycytidylate deaminase